MDVQNILSLIGALSLAILFARFASFLTLYARPSSLPRYNPSPKQRPAWALVTGATDGIGRALAEELARQGFHVLLHGRNPTKLDATRAYIEKTVPGSRCEIVQADAATAGDEDFTRIRAQVELLTYENDRSSGLRVLVNNVGGIPHAPVYAPLHTLSGADVDGDMAVNARFPTRITLALLPLLRRNTPSLVLNIGSMAGEVFPPYLSVYVGCKAYNVAFSAGLASECALESPGVEVLGLSVGEVDTAGHRAELGLFAPDARTFARAALRRVGCRRRVVNGYFWHAVQGWFLTLLPERVGMRLVAKKIVREKQQEYERMKRQQ
ncbi:MAG: hypothetical protein M1821_003835 [Bathelium mastoideum]|nr:MAG: hypothetical protein M1821_003835 [Bathelium mastoideum]